MLRCFALLLFLIAPLCHAYDIAVAPNGVLKTFPPCFYKGTPVEYIASQKLIWDYGFMGAVAGKQTNGKPVIVYDPIAFADAPPEFQLWVMGHECSHHEEGHMEAGMGYHPQVRFAIERESDRMAAYKIVRIGFTDEQIRKVYDTIRDFEYHNRNMSPQVRSSMQHNQDTLNKRAEYFLRSVETARRTLLGGH